MISQTSEYALRAAVHLAQRTEGPATAQDIAESIKVPVGYLQKILRMLARAGILSAQRGTGGGFTLAKVPTAISVLDVLSATDSGISRIERCPLGIKGHLTLCALHRLLDEQAASAEQVFSSTTIADLLTPVNGIRPLCETRAAASLTISGMAASKPTPQEKNRTH